MWQEVLTVIALMMVIEGVIPFLSPQVMRRIVIHVLQMDDNALRFSGLTSMVLGVILLYFIK